VESVHEHVFDNDRSGTGIAWSYFHPEISLPKMLAHVQDNDLWRSTLPSAKEIDAFLGTVEFDLAVWDNLVREFEDDAKFANIAERGKIYREYFDHIIAKLADKAELVLLGEYRVLAVNAPRFFRSALGHKLATKKSPFGIVWYFHHDKWHFSLRGDGSIDLTEIAKRYGGSGHKNAAAFRRPLNDPFPFTIIPKEEKL
jgi:oligoribonuclease NrnB/cAMP/cGMP phosphodiesterase (DHH superfamily)